MIIEIKDSEVVQVCARCGNVRPLAIAGLLAGVQDDQGDALSPIAVDPNGIRLPECSDCKSVEFLFRVADAFDPTPGGDHRRAVNALHRLLVERGQISSAFVSHFAAESGVELDVAQLPWKIVNP
jgi:hypothetical protein